MKTEASEPSCVTEDHETVTVAVNLQRLQNSLNSTYHRWIIRNPDEGDCSLKEFLIEKLPHLSKDSWEERSAWGGIHLMGKPASLDTRPLPVPGWVEYFEPRESLAQAKAELTPFDPSIHLLYDDEWIAVAFKPGKLHTNPAREQQSVCLRNALETHYKHAVHLPSRLDFSTSGIILVSKHPEAHKPVQHLYQKRLIQKYYLLGTESIPTWEKLTLSAPIAQDKRHPILRCLSTHEGKSATTKFLRLSQNKDANTSLLLAKPYTGRTHQIRLHIAALGHRILGDSFYNGLESPRLQLLCYALHFPHPKSNKLLKIQVPETLLPEWVQQHITIDSLNKTLVSCEASSES